MLFSLSLFALFISSDPIKLLNFLSDLVEFGFDRSVFSELSVGRGLGDDVVDLSPAIGLFFVDDDEGLSCSVGPCSPSRSMNVGISIDWNSHLYDVSDMKIEASGCHISGN